MTGIPDFEAFARAYQAGGATVAATTLVADLETPVSAYLKLARTRTGNMFLLESVEGGAQRGRYSMIGLDPDLVFRSTGERAEVNRRALRDPDAFAPCPGEPLETLRALLAESRIDLPPGLPPMAADGAAAAGQARSDRRARRPPHPPDGDGGVRFRARRDVGHHADPAGARGFRQSSAGKRAGAARRGRRRARGTARPFRARRRRPD